MSYPYILTTNFVSVTIEGKPYTVPSTHANFTLLVDAIKTKDWFKVKTVINITAALNIYCEGKIIIKDGAIRYNGELVDNSIAARIKTMMAEGFDVEPLVNFLDKLMDNPSFRATQELYGFLEHGKLPITQDGYFLAYKKVRGDFMDIHTGTFNNAVGEICTMDRNKVDEDKNRTCSAGLHFCSYDYLPSFGSSSDNKVIVLKISPADVVAIPADYNNTKGRCCNYEVIDVVADWKDENTLAKTSVYVGAEEGEGEEELCVECGCTLTQYEERICDSCDGIEDYGNDDDIPEYCEECGSVEVTYEGDVCAECRREETDEAHEVLTSVDEDDEEYEELHKDQQTFADIPTHVVVEDDEDTDIGGSFHNIINRKCNDCGGLLNAMGKECGYCGSTNLSDLTVDGE